MTSPFAGAVGEGGLLRSLLRSFCFLLQAMKHIGGKLLVFGACIPSVGELALKSTRDNPR